MSFAQTPHQAHLIAENTERQDKLDKIAEQVRWTHRIHDELKDALESADPKIKYWQETLDPLSEVIVRYEPGRHRYAIYTTDAGGTKINVALMSGFQFLIQTTAPQWLALDFPPGTKLWSGDATRHVVLVRSSNLKV